MLAVLESEDGDEEQSLVLAAQGLATAESADDRFSVAVAHESVGAALGGSCGSTKAARTWTRRSSRSRSSARAGSRERPHLARHRARYAGEPERAVRDLRGAYRLAGS